MNEVESRRRWNALMTSISAMRGYSHEGKRFVSLMSERNLQIIAELEEAEKALPPETTQVGWLTKWRGRL